MKKITYFILALFLAYWSATAGAQNEPSQPGIDIMLLIDNSCSMYPHEAAVAAECFKGNNSDPNFLRIIGGDLFLASLGFDEPADQAYQLGIVSFGLPPILIHPLSPLTTKLRGDLAKKIENPTPQFDTGILPALDLAYDQLDQNGNSDNRPAIVLITDGVPEPAEQQSTAQIEVAISSAEAQNIPLFIMLLENESGGQAFQNYVEFWQRMGGKYAHVFPFTIEDENEIDTTYNKIITEISGGSAGEPPVLVAPDQPYIFLVPDFAQRVIIRAIYTDDRPDNALKIEDPEGNLVEANQPGVRIFRDLSNPVEVFSLRNERLNGLTGKSWTIYSDATVKVYFDTPPAWNFQFSQPRVNLTQVEDLYESQRRAPNQTVTFTFQLFDNDGQLAKEPQDILGLVRLPSGQDRNLAVPADLSPNQEGVYTFTYDLKGLNVSPDQLENYIFLFEAYSKKDGRSTRTPIARSRIIIPIGAGPIIESIIPSKVSCDRSGAMPIEVIIGGTGSEWQVETISARYQNSEELLVLGGSGSYSADLSELCATALADMTQTNCSFSEATQFELRLGATTDNGKQLPAIIETIQAELETFACTATPAPSATATPHPTQTPTPTPSPTPIPDSDNDSAIDTNDWCPRSAGVDWLGFCPIWFLPILILVFALLGYLLFFVARFIDVSYLRKPPKAFMMPIEDGRKGRVYDTQQVGFNNRRRKILIGSDKKKADIQIDGLKPIELYVINDGGDARIFEFESDRPKPNLSDKNPTTVTTSNPKTKLVFSLNRNRLR